METTQPTEVIKMQCRDKDGNLLAYHNDIKDIEQIVIVKFDWKEKYGRNAYIISVHFINK